MTRENMNSPPENDMFGKMTEEELSSVLTQQFNTLMSDEENKKTTKEEEASFFDGVLKLHFFQNKSREELTTTFKNMMNQIDPEIPFFYDYQRPDYSVLIDFASIECNSR